MNEPLTVQEAPASYQVMLVTPHIKQGYKQTEVGVIPEDWEAVPLSRLGQFKNGINKDSEAFGHGSPFVNLMDVFGVSSITSGNAFGLVKTSDVEQKTYNLKHGDVIFIRSSVKPSGVGLTAVVEASLPKTVYSGFLIRFRDNDALDIGFKRHCFYSESFRNKLIAASSVSANTNINQDNLKKLLIALPPTATEQHAIATALSDVDALLVAQDKLIAKKRDIKQAAMQQLLTGKQRLPGFTGEWEVKQLGDVAAVVGGGTPSSFNSSYWNGTINWFTPTEIGEYKYTSESIRKITKTGFANCSGKMLPIGTILLTTRAGIGDLSILASEGCTNQGFQSLIAKEGNFNEYLYYLMQTLKSVLIKNASGSTFLEISPNKIRQIKVSVPTMEEQTAIASILSDMDADLSTLEQQRDKTHALKQGMMQELLTGRIRLV